MRKLIFILLLFPALLQAQTTWYIDADDGDDVTGNGTSSNPWKTFYRAVNQNTSLAGGDKVFAYNSINPYHEYSQIVVPINVDIEGESESGVVIESHLSSPGQALFLLQTTNGWLGNYGNQYISHLTIDGNNTTYSAIDVNYRSNVTLSYLRISDFLWRGIRLYGCPTETTPSIFESDRNMPAYFTQGNKVLFCRLTNNAGNDNGNLNIGRQDGVEIAYNTITQPLRSSTWTNCGGIKFADEGYNKNTKMHHNTISVTPNPANSFNFSIEMWYELGGCEYYNNTFRGTCDFDAARKGASTYSIWFHNNDCGFDNYVAGHYEGIDIEASCWDVIIEKNYIHHVAKGIQFSMIWPIGDHDLVNSNNRIRISSNLIVNLGLTHFTSWEPIYGINFYVGDTYLGLDSVQNYSIYNNTFHCGRPTSGSYYVTGIELPGTGSYVRNFNVKNNIFYGFDGASAYDAPIIGSGAVTPVTSSFTHNDSYGCGNSNQPLYRSGYSALTATANITSNPLFTLTGSTWTLQATSGAIHAGTYVSLTTDYAGNNYANPPSLGAYEYVGSFTLPVVSTSPVIEITATTASTGGNITSDGGSAVTARGVCWSTSTAPTTADSKTTNGTGTGSFTSNVTGLTNGETYYLRAYATNSIGTAYGLERVFTTPIPTSSGVRFIMHDGVFVIHNGKFIKSE